MTKKILFAAAVAVLVGAGCAASSSTAPQTPVSGQAQVPSAPAGQNAVGIQGFAFQPNALTIKAGQTVVWTNNDPMAHTVTADDGSFDSGPIASGATFSHTFTQAGTFTYHCTFHPSMKGKVTVQ